MIDTATKVVYLLNPTSNHNQGHVAMPLPTVVYLLNPTSNHNCCLLFLYVGLLYIF